MEFLYCLLFVLQIKCAEAQIYYSQNSTGTHIEATNFCSTMNGSLLRYGELFNKVVGLCGNIGVSVWTGLPFYEKLPECYIEVRTTGTTVFLHMSAENRTQNKHVAICADFCGGNIYKNFSVNIDDCRCYGNYNQSPIPDYHLQCPDRYGLQCPGNEHDKCGKNENQSIVYQKIQSYLPDQRCQYRKYFNNTSYGKNMEVNCSSQSLSYICRVGNSNDIFCGFEEPFIPSSTTGTTDSRQSETELPSTTSQSETELPSNTSFVSQIMPVMPTRKTQLCGTSISNELVIGLAVAVGVFTIILFSILITYICFRRKSAISKATEDTGERKSNSIPSYSVAVPKHKRGNKKEKHLEDTKHEQEKRPSKGKKEGKYNTPEKDEIPRDVKAINSNKHVGANNDVSKAIGECYTLSPEETDKYSQKLQYRKEDDLYIVNPEGVYDSTTHPTAKQPTESDNIYDHQLDDVYDTSLKPLAHDNPDIYDHT